MFHPETARLLAQAKIDDLHREAQAARLAASVQKADRRTRRGPALVSRFRLAVTSRAPRLNARRSAITPR